MSDFADDGEARLARENAMNHLLCKEIWAVECTHRDGRKSLVWRTCGLFETEDEARVEANRRNRVSARSRSHATFEPARIAFDEHGEARAIAR